MRRALWILLGSVMLAGTALAQEAGEAGAPAEAPSEGEAPAAAAPSEGEAPAAEAASEGDAPAEAGEPLPAGHPPVAGGPHGGSLARALGPPAQGHAAPSEAIAAGTIRVTVVDAQGQPVPDAPVDVGVRSQTDERTRHNARTDASGVAVFDELPTGTGQAYRVNVPYLGATFSSSPFQLPPDRGYDVRITRLPVTRDDAFVFFHVFRVIVELRDERLHVIHQAELTNAGQETYVFPAEGARAALPEEATAFQAQRVMTDQRVEEIAGEGYALRGSLPPGTIRLAWAYDIPIEDETMRVPVDIPMRFFGLQVFSEAPEGLAMDVSGMPNAQRIDNEGNPVWLTQMRRGPSDPAIEHVTVTVSGIPGPGPLRWFAVGLALLFVVAGVFMRFQRADDRGAVEAARARRRQALLDEIRELEEEFEEGEIGPEFRQSRRAELVRALAALLHEEDLPAARAGR